MISSVGKAFLIALFTAAKLAISPYLTIALNERRDIVI
jgi:hypothetical protein